MPTNAEFAKTDKPFLKACETVKRLPYYTTFEPSTRQASKWRMGKGIAWKVAHNFVKTTA